MMNTSYAPLFGLVVLLCAGCAVQPRYTQAQLNAIETREVDASFDETYKAAASALFDAGYIIAMSDRPAGLVTGQKKNSRAAQRFWISPYIEDVQYQLSIQVIEIEPQRCTVRVKTAVNGESRVQKKAIDQIWLLMQRQVLMNAALPFGVAESG